MARTETETEAAWSALWDDLRHNATGDPSGRAIIAKHRSLIEREAVERFRAEAIAGVEGLPVIRRSDVLSLLASLGTAETQPAAEVE